MPPYPVTPGPGQVVDNGCYFNPTNIYFEWPVSPGATWYELQFWGPGGGEKPLFATKTSLTYYNYSNYVTLSEGNNWQVILRAGDGSGNASSWSTTWVVVEPRSVDCGY
jgi:hypothetical protein